MKRPLVFLSILMLLGLISQAQAQNAICPTAPNGDSTNRCASTKFVQNAFGGASSLTLPQYDFLIGDSSGKGANTALSGDCVYGASGLVCTKTNGTAFAASATTDATNASNISSGTLSSARLPASGVTAATYGDSSHIPSITIDGTGRVTGASQTSLASGSPIPGGRLVAVASSCTGAPAIQAAAISSTSTLCYVPFKSDEAQFGSTTLSFSTLSLDISGMGNPDIYDVFLIDNAGSVAVCYDAAAWSSLTPGAVTRADAIELHNGVWVNSATMTTCTNGGTSYSSLAAQSAVYVGSVWTTAAGTTEWTPTPTTTGGVSGGSNNIIGLYNAYNKVPLTVVELDSESRVTYDAATWTALFSNVNNQIQWIDGLGDMPVRLELHVSMEAAATCSTSVPCGGSVGICVDPGYSDANCSTMATVTNANMFWTETNINVVPDSAVVASQGWFPGAGQNSAVLGWHGARALMIGGGGANNGTEWLPGGSGFVAHMMN